MATVAGLALFVYLGQWQAGKGERLALQRAQVTERARLAPQQMTAALVEPEAVMDAPMRVRGQFEAAGQFFVDNRQENGVPGLHVITPLRIEGSETRVLVNRGWVAWPQGRQTLPTVASPDAVVELVGLAVLPSVKKFWLMPENSETRVRLWSQLDLPRFAAQVNYAVQPVVLLQKTSTTPDGLLRNWQAPQDRVAMHKSYAMQWFGMAIALLIFYVAVSTRREAKP